MPKIVLREEDSIESINRKFRKMCEFVISEVNKRKTFKKRSAKRREKAIAARRRFLKRRRGFRF